MPDKYIAVKFGESITSETLASFRRPLAAAVQEGNAHVLVDLTGAHHIYSFGISLLIKTKKILLHKKRLLFVMADRPSLLEVFQRINLHKIIPVYHDLEAFEFEFYRQAGGEHPEEDKIFTDISLTVRALPASRNLLVLELEGLFTTAADRHRLRAVLAEHRAFPQVLLDCRNLTFMDTGAVGFLLEVRLDLQKKKTGVALCGLSEFLRELFEKSNLLTLMPSFPDRTTALNNLRS